VVISNIPGHVRIENFEEELSTLTNFTPFLSCEKLPPREDSQSDAQAVSVMYDSQDQAKQ